MKLKDILAKITKGDELTDAEKTFLSDYDSDKASNDAVAAYRRKADEKLTKAEQERDDLKKQVEAINGKLAEKDNAGKSKDQQQQDQIKALSDQIAGLTTRLETTDREKAELSRKTTINSLREQAGIKFIGGVSEEILSGAFAGAFEGIDDLNDDTLTKPVIERFMTTNKAVIADLSGHGAGGNPHVGNGGQSTTAKNPWKTDSLNLTEQGKIFKENPAEAKRLAAEAGTNLEV